ncbi:MATE family efflux transporter [Desmospora activa]|uniref:Multidrug export protein MepA n=1 Tax=Desmospora activa DSM 45169 TaxID=1121389 RepID=A0A2T4Z0T4_9BACL|nr:MATE family efflux transporter [Desmospora activa]PTM53320.1 putative MATE family efflux protein [Desmospora activa DSM 45169]
MEHSNPLSYESIPKLLWKMSVPAVLGMLINALYNIMDTIFIAHGVGILGVAGLSIAFPVQMIILALAGAIGLGGASVVSRRLGEGRRETANTVFGNLLLMVFGVGILGVVCALFFLKPLLRLFGATDMIMPYASDYLFPILMGTLFSVFVFTSNNLIRSEGNAKVVFILMATGSLLNIVLDPIFIFGFHMGTQGAAIATVLAHIVTSILAVFYFLSEKSNFSLGINSLQPKLHLMKEVLVIGLPAGIQLVAGSLMIVAVNYMLNVYSGAIAVGVFGIIYRIITFTSMPINGVVQGMQPIVGYNFGSNHFQRVNDTITLGLKVASVTSIIIFIVMMIFPEWIMRVFSSDKATVAQGIEAIRIVFAASFLIGLPIVIGGLYQALGFARKTLILSMARQVLFLLPLVLILPSLLGVNGVWLAFPTADLLAFFLSILYLYKDRNLLSNT